MPAPKLLKRIADVLDLDFAKMLTFVGVTYRPQRPTLATYLREERGLPEEAIAEAEAAIEHIAAKYRRDHGQEMPSD